MISVLRKLAKAWISERRARARARTREAVASAVEAEARAGRQLLALLAETIALVVGCVALLTGHSKLLRAALAPALAGKLIPLTLVPLTPTLLPFVKTVDFLRTLFGV